MKRFLTGIWVSLLYQGVGFGQPSTVSDIEKQIPHAYKIIEFPLDQGKSEWMAIGDTIASTYSLAKLINNHTAYLGYVFANYSSVRDSHLLTPGMTLRAANDAYHQAIAKDTLFNRLFLTMAAYYLQAQGSSIKHFTPPAKPVLTMPALLQIASRFFERVETAPNGGIIWHLNQPGIALSNYDPTSQNQPLIEAFCSEAVMNWSYTKDFHSFPYDADFYAEVKSLEARTASLISADEQRQLVRPAMRELISKNKVLEKMLLAEYEHAQDWLGFRLIR